ncbi:MAG: DUF1579 family protein [Phycisphaerales bacterium]|nr:DUF1579 family protein [Phycisphaerales bacterium]
MMIPEPQNQHKWLARLVGPWEMEGECMTGPGQPPMKVRGREVVRSLGGLWTIGEGVGEMPGGGESRSIMTLGYDPQRQKFVGSFIASVMTHLWLYEGSLDASGKVLTLDCKGPNMMPGANPGELMPYQDIIEFVDDNHRILRSRAPGPDGKWVPFMEAHYHRTR